MTKPAVIRAEFTDYRPIKTRKVLQLVFEVPAESQTEVFAALGYPIMGTSSWVAIAKLASGAQAPLTIPAEPLLAPEGALPTEKPRTSFKDLPRSQQAALKCQDESFQEWLEVVRHNFPGGKIACTFDGQPMKADFVLKNMLGITSKRQLDFPNSTHGEKWDKLLTDFSVRDMAR